MMLRQSGCRACAAISSGDCGQHGPWTVTLNNAAIGPSADAQIQELKSVLALRDAERDEACRVFNQRVRWGWERADRAEAQVRHLTKQVADLEIECIESDKQADQELIAQYQASEGWRTRAEAAEATGTALRQQLQALIDKWRVDAKEATRGGWIEPGVRLKCADELAAALAGVSAPPDDPPS